MGEIRPYKLNGLVLMWNFYVRIHGMEEFWQVNGK